MASTETPPVDRRRALLIGVDAYEDARFEPLRAPSGDVQRLAEVLRDEHVGGYDVQEPLVNATEREVTEALEALCESAASTDMLLVYISCHGVMSSDRRLFFAASDTKVDRLRSTGIPDTFVDDVMRHSFSPQIVLLLDCCHSGAFHGLLTKGAPEVGLAGRFDDGAGRVTLSASTALEYAFEDDRVQELDGGARGSVFTNAVVEGLRSGEADQNRDGHVSVDELYAYVYRKVGEITSRQRPEKSGELRGDIFVARSPNRVVGDLPSVLADAAAHRLVKVRRQAVMELGALRRGEEVGLARAADRALRKLAEDRSPSVAGAAVRELIQAEAAATRDGRSGAPVASDPAAVEAIGRGQASLVQAHHAEAIVHFTRALKVDPRSVEALALRGTAHLGQLDLEAAHTDFEGALQLDSRAARALTGRARLKLFERREKEAKADVARALKVAPELSDAHVVRGWIRLAAVPQQAGAALKDFDHAAALDPTSAEAVAGRGYARHALGSASDAIADYDAALELNSRCVEALAGRALARATLNDATGALEDAEVAVSVNPRSPAARTARGVVHFQAGEHDHARADLEAALELAPDYFDALALLGGIHLHNGDHNAAQPLLERAHRMQPKDPTVLTWYGLVSANTERWPEAFAAFDAVLEHDPEGRKAGVSVAELLRLRAGAALELDRPKQALADLDRALELEPESPEALASRLRARAALGETKVVLTDIEQLRRLAPDAEEELVETRRYAIFRLGADLASRPRPRSAAARAQQLEHNRKILTSVDIENGWYFGQRDALLDYLTGDEELIWLCRCARYGDLLRQTALLITSRQAVWCHEGFFGGPHPGCVDWDEVLEVGTGGLALKTAGGTIGFLETGRNGIDVGNHGLELDESDLFVLVRGLVEGA